MQISQSKPENAVQSARPIEILLVDDDDDDVLLAKKTLERDRILNRIHRVDDGVEAMAYLRREGQYTTVPRPDLILLDLNMPRMSGRDVLKQVKESEEFKSIPVVVLTSSDDERDVHESYEHQANSYVTKPVDLSQFREVLQAIKSYWFSVVKLPSPEG